MVASVTVALVLLLLLLLTPREPMHQGKTLKVWLNQYQTNRWPLDKEAEQAIQHFGSNATPTLLKMMKTRESPLKIKLLGLVPKGIQQRFHVQTPNDYRKRIGDYRRIGASGFRALDEHARPAVPALIAMLDDKDEDVRYLAVFALRTLGPVAKDALPSLTNCLTDPEFTIRDDAVMAMGTIHADPERTVPLIIQFLEKNRGDRILCRDAIDALGQFGSNAAPAIPLLRSFLQDINLDLREAATNAFRRIDPDAAATAGTH